MKYFVSGGTAHVGPGVTLLLTARQAELRKPFLKPVEGGFEPTQVVQFREGEELEIDTPHAQLPRGLAVVLTALDGPQPDGEDVAPAKARKGSRA